MQTRSKLSLLVQKMKTKVGKCLPENNGGVWPRRREEVTVGAPERKKKKTARGDLQAARQPGKEADRRWPAASPEHSEGVIRPPEKLGARQPVSDHGKERQGIPSGPVITDLNDGNHSK